MRLAGAYVREEAGTQRYNVGTDTPKLRDWEVAKRGGEGGVGECSRDRRVTTLSFALLRYSVAARS
jgi:hypothetical protein